MSTATQTPAKKTATTKISKVGNTKVGIIKTQKAAAEVNEGLDQQANATPELQTPKAAKGKTIRDLSVRSYQELAKMYGNGFVGMNKAALIAALEERAN
jgi:hypothetical protein